MRKTFIKGFVAILLILFTCFAMAPKEQEITVVEASGNATSYTYSLDARGNGLIRTQDAYLPNKTATGIGLGKPSDLFIDEDNLIYVADTGTKDITPAVKVFDNNLNLLYTISGEHIKGPRGVYITYNNDLDNRILYIADSSARNVYLYTYNETTEKFEYYAAYGKPTSALFRDRNFEPAKVSADINGNIYVVADGIGEGIIQLDKKGAFLGYFATNKVRKGFMDYIYDFLFTAEQKKNLGLTVTSPLFSNLFTDKDGLLYSTTNYAKPYTYVQKHNTAGINLFTKYELISSQNPVDIYVDDQGIVYVGDKDGYIYIYTNDGEFLCLFGGSAPNDKTDIDGLFDTLVSIAVDKNGKIWCIDGVKASIHSFTPTDYSNKIYAALAEYDLGHYDESIALWEEVIELNQMSSLAHNNIGLNYLYNEDYDNAMEHLKIARNREAYSKAYWEVRNIWIQNNLVTTLLILLGVVVGIIILKKVHKKTNCLAFLANGKQKFDNYKLVKDLKFTYQLLRRPTDSFYDLRAGKRGSTLGATILYIVTFAVFLWYTVGKGFIYQYIEAFQVDFVALTAGYVGIIGLFIYCNYMVTSIQDGEGPMISIYRTIGYSLVPWMISMIAVTILSHFLTYDDVFLLQVIQYVGIGLTAFMIFMGIENIHNYTVWQTIKSILLTVAFMFIILLVVLIITMLTGDLLDYLGSLLKEAIRNVFG